MQLRFDLRRQIARHSTSSSTTLRRRTNKRPIDCTIMVIVPCRSRINQKMSSVVASLRLSTTLTGAACIPRKMAPANGRHSVLCCKNVDTDRRCLPSTGGAIVSDIVRREVLPSAFPRQCLPIFASDNGHGNFVAAELCYHQ